MAVKIGAAVDVTDHARQRFRERTGNPEATRADVRAALQRAKARSEHKGVILAMGDDLVFLLRRDRFGNDGLVLVTVYAREASADRRVEWMRRASRNARPARGRMGDESLGEYGGLR